MIFLASLLLLLIRPKMLVLLEPCEIHGLPLLVPSLLEVLRGPISSGDLRFPNQLFHSPILVVLEDGVATPDIPDGGIEIFRFREIVEFERSLNF